jgi:hypothetical protein
MGAYRAGRSFLRRRGQRRIERHRAATGLLDGQKPDKPLGAIGQAKRDQAMLKPTRLSARRPLQKLVIGQGVACAGIDKHRFRSLHAMAADELISGLLQQRHCAGVP